MHNQFTFGGDPDKFSYQHDARRIANGHLTLFDNGNYHFPPKSASKEYILDEVNKTAVLTWKYERNLTGSSSAMGSTQRLPNGNTFICWGLVYSTVFPSVTEVTPEGNVVWEMRLDPEFNDGIYRAHRFVWTPCARPFTNSMQALNVTTVSSKLKWQNATNANSYEVQYKPSASSAWTTKTTNKRSMNINGLAPNTTYDWKVKSVCSAPNPPASGYSGIKKFTTLPQKLSEQNAQMAIAVYPNPASDLVNIEINQEQAGILVIRVVNMMGQVQLVKQFGAQAGENTFAMEVSTWPKGTYFVEATCGNERSVGKVTVE